MNVAKTIRYGAWAAVALLVAAVSAVTVMKFVKEDVPQAATVQIGGPFELVDGKGQVFTDKNLDGKPTLMFFGFTYCPDVCPTTLSDMQGWIDNLGPKADDLNFVFVSVDPERDTPDVIADYVAAFGSHVVPLTGSVDQVKKVVKDYRVYARKVPLEDGDYTMDHTAAVYMLNGDLDFVGTISYQEPEETALPKIRKLLGSS
ncbi:MULTISPECIES: SCO family protein [Pseudovibrio]|jgi:protein SCO1/2|uniref:Protein SCO1/2 n=2 Tax=Pseudovibrio TaxID=258255 RepID=A0A1I3WTJ6_9HYPH|nr:MULTISPECIES: SCO family protein [Pseudovibrio]KZK90220.1 SCO1/SenC [Pseudovibrio sp. Ad5]KZK91519.1 SCO1/SenC [Pseudovibrio sp. Ad46]KZL14145.1 SCO1/SenC [Pseudovibrio sp. Ad26]SFK10670.1 protein SCO1/2 [Pseudovibrio ascidiaceicola]